MLANLASVAVLGAVGLAVWLLPKYIESRVTNAARGVVDKRVGRVLATFCHELAKSLEDHRGQLAKDADGVRQILSLERERFSKDYALFASRRSEIYAETYSLLEKAVNVKIVVA